MPDFPRTTTIVSGQPVYVQNMSGQALYVQISGAWDIVSDSIILANGGEQDLINDTSRIGEFWGYVDLSKMVGGDTVILRQYFVTNAVPSLYQAKTYTGIQAEPLIAVRPRPITKGYRFTLQQTGGVMKTYSYNFNCEYVWHP